MWDLDPRTPPVVQVTPYYNKRIFFFLSRKLTNKSENVFNFVHPGFHIKVNQYTATRYTLIRTETTEQHNQIWQVNMISKTKGWPVNSPISPDIVRWPAIISSPGPMQPSAAHTCRKSHNLMADKQRSKKCSNSTQWPLVPNSCSWVTRIS